MAMKKDVVKFEITEDGISVDILNAVGPSCAKDAQEWADIIGSPKSVHKKPEYFKQADQKQKNIQTNKELNEEEG